MDPGLNPPAATGDSNAEHLRAQHLRELRALIEDYTLQKVDIGRERDQAREKATRIAEERDAVQAAYEAEIDLVKKAHQALEQATTELIKKKKELKAMKKLLLDEQAKAEKTKNSHRNKLALTTASMTKRLDQAAKRERDERTDKEEMKRLNAELIERSHLIQQEMADLKKTHKESLLKYSDSLAEKIDLLRQYGVSLACSQFDSSDVIVAKPCPPHRSDCQHRQICGWSERFPRIGSDVLDFAHDAGRAQPHPIRDCHMEPKFSRSASPTSGRGKRVGQRRVPPFSVRVSARILFASLMSPLAPDSSYCTRSTLQALIDTEKRFFRTFAQSFKRMRQNHHYRT